MILEVESVNFDELKEKRRAFRKDHIKSVHEMFSAIMFIKKERFSDSISEDHNNLLE